jgi:DNA-directed RNA polymerase subunit alpha
LLAQEKRNPIEKFNSMKNFFLTCKECILENPRKFYGAFYLGPFNNSQSLTIANGLRRTLLSEISGLGIQMVEIEGVEHEFCTYPGLRESILDLLLNFKQIVLVSNLKNNEGLKKQFKKLSLNNSENLLLSEKLLAPPQKPFYGYLQAKGPGILRASDLKLPPSIQCVDPNQYIATLTNDGHLNLRFSICEGLPKIQKIDLSEKKSNLAKLDGFFLANSSNRLNNQTPPSLNDVSKKEKFQNSKPLLLDPVFTPILKVNYLIESYGSQELNTANQVVLLELWTNGSLHPRDALYKTLNKLYSVFSKLEKMQYLNTYFAKSILNSDKTYFKTLKKLKYDYDLYKRNFPNNTLKSVTANVELKKNFSNFLADPQKTDIDYLELPFRITNCLKNANLLTMHNLLNCKLEDLKNLPGIGDQSLILILKKLNEKGFSLKF